MLKILKAGFYTSIQDNGRFGYLNKGVPRSGVMDTISVNKLNHILANKRNAAVMEITMTGPSIEFTEPTFICLGGADIEVSLNEKKLHRYQVYKVLKGDVLTYGILKNGFRSYLAIKNGFLTQEILKSRSYYFPVTAKSNIEKGSEIKYEPYEEYKPKIVSVTTETILDENLLEVSKGPEYEFLNDRQLGQLFGRDFTVAKEYDRMAYQLEQSIDGHEISGLTSATLPGTVQFTSSGKLIILMKDGQTTGGYPRILQLSDKAISILAQKKYKDQISFALT